MVKLKVGDTIEVTTWHLREGWKTATRKVTAIDLHGNPGIRMFGWSTFWLSRRQGDKWKKVKPVEKKAKVN